MHATTDVTMTKTRQQIDELADAIAVCAARIDAATHQLLKYIREFDLARGWAAQRAQSCAHWLSWRIGCGLGAAMERLGNRCDLHYFPGEVHAFHAFVWRQAARRAWQIQFEFLDDVLAC